MRWIIDAQLPPALAEHLTGKGHQAEHVIDVGLGNASDSKIWNYALKHQAIIITKDEDFQTRALVAGEGPAMLWLRIGNCSRRALLKWLDPLLEPIEKRIESGERLIEVI